MTVTTDGPYVTMAALCEYVLEEKKDNVLSAIRIIDRVDVHIPPGAAPENLQVARLNITALLSFTAGFICVCSQKRVRLWSAATWRSFSSLAPPPLVAKDYQSGDKSPHSIPVHATEKRCKSGSATGKKTLSILVTDPLGVQSSGPASPLVFEGNDHGVNVILRMALKANHEGIYWFDVFIDDRFMTRMPLRIRHVVAEAE